MHESEGEPVLPEDDPSDTLEDMTHEQQVQEALQTATSIHGIEVELRPCDRNEEEVVAQFVATGCSCAKQCSSQFSKEYIKYSYCETGRQRHMYTAAAHTDGPAHKLKWLNRH